MCVCVCVSEGVIKCVFLLYMKSTAHWHGQQSSDSDCWCKHYSVGNVSATERPSWHFNDPALLSAHCMTPTERLGSILQEFILFDAGQLSSALGLA